MKMNCIYPTREQRIQEERKNIIGSPKNKKDAEKNKRISERIKKIKEVFI